MTGFREYHADAKIAHPLDIVDPVTLHGLPAPERRWLVPHWVPLRNVTMLGGDGGLGKSIVAMQLLTACATGGKWLGQDAMRCKTLGIFCEDETDELHRRQAAINTNTGLEFGELEDMQWVERVGRDNLLFAPSRDGGLGPTELFGRIVNQAVGQGAQLVVLDSLHDLFGGNENIRGDARQFIGLLRQLAIEIDGAVVLTAHPSLSGRNSGTGEAGSTAWNNAVRSRLYLFHDDADQDKNNRVLARKKSNYAGADDALHLTWREGVFEAEHQDSGTVAGIKRRSAEQVFIRCFDILSAAGVDLSDSVNGSNYAPRRMADLPEAERHRYPDLAKSMNNLLARGEFKLEEFGSPSRRKKRLARVHPPPEPEV